MHISQGIDADRATFSRIILENTDAEELLLDDTTWRCPAKAATPASDHAADQDNAGRSGPRPPEARDAAEATSTTGSSHAAETAADHPPPPKNTVVPENPMQWPLGNRNWQSFGCHASDQSGALPSISLRNANIAHFPFRPMSWPPLVDFRSLHFDRLGNYTLPDQLFSEQGMNRKEWLDLLARSQPFNSQPYVQAATVLAAEGEKDISEAIPFAGIVRERNEAWVALECQSRKLLGLRQGDDCKQASPDENGRPEAFLRTLFRWALLSIGALIGYGIGLYSLWAFAPLIGLTLIGTATLYRSPRLIAEPIRSRHGRLPSLIVGFLWRAGASFQKILPLIEFYKPFKEFLDNPDPRTEVDKARASSTSPSTKSHVASEDIPPRNLSRWQVFIFSTLSLIGWVLGGAIGAAIGGLTQKG